MSTIDVVSPLNASVWQIEVAVGQRIARHDPLVILESMKTEIPVEAPADGVVKEVRVEPGMMVAESQVLVVIEA